MARTKKTAGNQDNPSTLWSVCYAIRLIWAADRKGILLTVGGHLGSVLALVSIILLARNLLSQAVPTGGGSGGTSGGAQSIAVLLMTVALSTVSGVLRIAIAARQRILAVFVDRYILDMVLRTVSRTELAEFETPAFQNRLQRAVFASRSQPAMVVTALLAGLQAILTIGAVVVVLAAMAWWLLPVALIGAVPVLRAARDERRAGYNLNRELAETRRVRQYFEQLLTGWQEAKEIQALHLGDLLRQPPLAV